MASGTGTGLTAEESALREVESILKGFMNGGRIGASLVPEIENVGTVLAEGAGAVAVAGSATGETEFAAIASGLIDLIILVFLFEIVVSIRILRWIEQIFVWLVGNIPLAGSGLAGVIKHIFSVLDPLENAVAIACANLAVGIIQSTINVFTGLMSWAGYQIFPSGSQAPKPKDQFQQIEKQITTISKTLAYVVAHMGTINYTVSNPAQPAGVPQNLWNQIHGLQSDVANLKKGLSATQGRTDTNARAITNVQHEIQSLTQSVHAVRAVSTGWQDVEMAVSQLQSTMTSFVNATTADINTQRRAITHLEPLGLLLTAGMPGLKILRQLEDTPCMCPRIPSIPSLTPEWLAMYEFITNG